MFDTASLNETFYPFELPFRVTELTEISIKI